MTGRMAVRVVWSLVAAAVLAIAVAVTSLPAPATAEPPARTESPPPTPAEAADAPAPPAPDPRFVVRRILPIDGPLKIGDWHWDEAGAPAAGAVVVTVDLEAQILSVFRNGFEIGTAAILYGREDKPTPLGAFPITEKDADHVSNLYHVPMPWMLRLTGDGISIHGSDGVAPGFATHGCVAVPVAFARKLFAVAKLGDLVIVTDGKRLQMGEAIVRG